MEIEGLEVRRGGDRGLGVEGVWENMEGRGIAKGVEVIVPIRKKGKGDEVVDYRGVTIMPTLDKIYTAALTERLRGEVEGKELIPPNQTGFRKGLGTVDNIYVLNYIVNRQIEKVES